MVYTILWRDKVTRESYYKVNYSLPMERNKAIELLLGTEGPRVELMGIIPGQHEVFCAPPDVDPIRIAPSKNLAFVITEIATILVLRSKDKVDIWVEDFYKNKKYILTLGEDKILEFKNKIRK